MLEVILAIAGNLQCVAQVVAIVATIFAVVIGGVWAGAMCEEAEDAAKFLGAIFKKLCWVIVPMTILCIIPTASDLWKVRIALIKLELASPTNLKSGVETIERIAEKLECKYLGCEEKKK